MSRWCLAIFALVAALVVALAGAPRADAAPFQPPPLDGHVVDASGTLSAAQKQELGDRLDRFRQDTGYAVVAFIVPSLDGREIDDVAYETFNTWKIGDEKKDNGVLLVVALSEKRSRIETGKGVGGELTDIESVEILRQTVTPALKAGDVFGAVDNGTRAIQASLTEGAPEATPPGARRDAPAPWYSRWILIAGVLLVGLLAVVSPRFRWVLLAVLQSMLLSRSGGGGRGGFGGGGFSGGGGGYSGGGGRSGGGGASDG